METKYNRLDINQKFLFGKLLSKNIFKILNIKYTPNCLVDNSFNVVLYLLKLTVFLKLETCTKLMLINSY